MLTVGQEDCLLTEIKAGNYMWAVAFVADGKYLVSGGRDDLQVWRVKDGQQIVKAKNASVQCLAVSKDGRWFAAGTRQGDVLVWDAKTYEKAFSHWHREASLGTNGVDFSPDSTRLVSASHGGTATIWDIAAREPVQTLQHDYWLVAAKYSPEGDRIATANLVSVRVWDSNDGCLLVDIRVGVTPRQCNTGLLWLDNHLFVLSRRKITQFESSTGSAVSEWPVPGGEDHSCIALPKHGEFIAYSTRRTVTFWDTATHAELGLIQHSQDIRSIAFSPDDRFLSIGEMDGKITINSLFPITVSIQSRWIVVHTDNFLFPIVLP